MGSTSNEVAGPNLKEGTPLAQLREGIPLAGRVDDQAVLLIKAGAEIFAIGATCTHYSGPLGEGLVTGDFIRCPWHHACFSIRTGAAVAPPALNPIPRWSTRIEADRVYVGDRLEEAAASKRPRYSPASVVIVGAGAAGMKAAETLREEGYDGSVTMIDPDAAAPYDRPNLSKDFLAGTAPEAWLPLRTADFYTKQKIARITDIVISMDVAGRKLKLGSGNELGFEALLLATGATPIRPPIPGHDQPHVHVLRSLTDCRKLIAAAGAHQKVVIAGASFIGLEAAAALRHRGAPVVVVAPEAVPFARVLGEQLGRVIQAQHEQHGVSFHLGRTLSAINDQAVELDNGESMAADLVLLAVGVRPAVELAAAAGLQVDNGVVVNALLETSAPGIFAAGDMARFPYAPAGELVRIEHWVVAQRQGQTAARNILGAGLAFAAVPFFWTQHYELPVAYSGHARVWDDLRVEGDPAAHDCVISYLHEGRLLAVATINRDQANLRAEIAQERFAHT